jgi:hypothetical protein
MATRAPASRWNPLFSLSQEAELEFEDRNNFEIQRMVDFTLEIATNGLEWARKRESERLDQEHDCVEWWPSNKNDEGYLIAELAEALPTHLSIIKTILLLQSEPVGSDEENVVRFKGLLWAGKITNQFVFNIVAACCDFYAFGWMARQIAGDPPFQHFHGAWRVTSSLVDCDAEFEKTSAIAR